MALNFEALKGAQENLLSRGSGGVLYYANKIEGEIDVRLLPPLPHHNGLYFIEQIVWWINNVPYIDPATFGEDSPFDEVMKAEIYPAAKTDPQLKRLLDDKDKFGRKSRFLMPMLMLKVDFDKTGAPIYNTIKVEGDKPKVLVCGPQLMKAINKVVTSRNFQNGLPDGLMDREKGHNLILGKTGKNLETDYTAEGWLVSTSMDAKYYNEAEMPDVVKLTEDEMRPNQFYKEVLYNYFFGDPMPADPLANKDNDSAPKRTGRSAPAAGETQQAEPDLPTARPSRTGAAQSAPVEQQQAEQQAPADDLPQVTTGGRRGGASVTDTTLGATQTPQRRGGGAAAAETPAATEGGAQTSRRAAAGSGRAARSIANDLQNLD